MTLLKRLWCLLTAHDWAEDPGSAIGRWPSWCVITLRCARCGKEKDA